MSASIPVAGGAAPFRWRASIGSVHGVLALLTMARWLRRSPGSLLGLAVVLTMGMGAALGSLEAAARTENAYASYLRRAEVGELVVNPNLITERAEHIIASTPGVRSYVSDSILTATPDGGDPRTEAVLDSDLTQVRMSVNGRYADQDRPVVQEGRMIRQGAEALVNVEMAKALSIKVGDTLPLAFWSGFSRTPFAHSVSLTEGSDEPPSGPSGESRLVEPVGRVEARVVGIGVFPDEVLLDGLYPRHRVVITPDVGAPFDCTYSHPGTDDSRPLVDLTRSIVPADCATAYRYFSLRVVGGDRSVEAVTSSLTERFAEENSRLPAALKGGGIGFDPTPTITADERERVERSLAPAVTALQLFGAGAAASTIVIVLLGAVRMARRERDAVGVWRDLGATRAMRTGALVLPLAAATTVGLGASSLVGWLTSAIGPVASARLVDPAGRFGLSASVGLLVLGGSAMVLGVGLVLVAATAARSEGQAAPRKESRRSNVMVRTNSPSLTLGVRSAADGGAARALLAASVAAVTAVLAVVVFSTSLAAMVSKPDRFGWPYDIAGTLDLGYGGTTNPEAIAATLDRPEVETWGLASIAGSLTINEETMPYVAGRTGFDSLRIPVVAGRPPVGSDEIALGALTARRLRLDVGAEVLVKTAYGDRRAPSADWWCSRRLARSRGTERRRGPVRSFLGRSSTNCCALRVESRGRGPRASGSWQSSCAPAPTQRRSSPRSAASWAPGTRAAHGPSSTPSRSDRPQWRISPPCEPSRWPWPRCWR